MKIFTPDNKPAQGRGKIDPYMKAIFLAGPTPRSNDVKGWRPEALEILERADWAVKFNYDDQITWELNGLDYCNVIMFWIPRNMETLPGLTTNVEFGMNIKNNSVIYGRPDGAIHTKYLDTIYQLYTQRNPCKTLQETVECTLQIL
jgi:hypothetical protein